MQFFCLFFLYINTRGKFKEKIMLASGLYKLGRRLIKSGRLLEKTGKPDIPRYLYHMTTKQNYESILKSGKIHTSCDCSRSNLDGVFMFAMQNFSKRWANTVIQTPNAKVNLGSVLLCKKIRDFEDASKGLDIVLLKIPTKGMDISKLRVRPQQILTKNSQEILNGDSALYKSIYTHRKNAIEYIYENNIDTSHLEKVGTTTLKFESIDDLAKTAQASPFDILLNLVKGHPEEKCVRAFKNADIKQQTIKAF